ncbi:MAG: single-stranded DNA-binding protein [Paramuribaculum sp.]|nr:single-stranded DNA-binding protein [Paramuribaculum sp.]
MSVNKVILVGNVGREPVVRYVETRAVAEISLATTERGYTTSSGTKVEDRTEWHRLIMWDAAAETAEKYITKGTKLYVEGKLRTRNWTDRTGISHRVTEVYVDSFDILSRPTGTNQ